MARPKSLEVQRRELMHIFQRLSTYATSADRDLLTVRLRNLLVEPKLPEFYRMVDDCFERLREWAPSTVEEIRTYFYAQMNEVKYDYRTKDETTTLMCVGMMLSSIFKSTPPDITISEETAEGLVALLKKHFINPKARIVVHHQLLRSNQGPASNPEIARPLMKRMMATDGVLYRGDDFATVDDPYDPVTLDEKNRDYGLYILHALISVTVPKDELTVVHPFQFLQAPLKGGLVLHDYDHKQTIDANRLTQSAWCREAADVFHDNVRNFNVIVAEPLALLRGIEFLETDLGPFRMVTLVMNALHTADATPSSLVASIAHFCSRPDAKQNFAPELRIAISKATNPAHPFTGDLILAGDTVQVAVMLQENLKTILESLGLRTIVFHPDSRFFEVEEDGRTYVASDGTSTQLTPFAKLDMTPPSANFLN